MASFVLSLTALINIGLPAATNMCIWNASFAEYGYNGLYRNSGKFHNNKPYYTKYSSCGDFYLAYFEYSYYPYTESEYHWGISSDLIDNYWGGHCDLINGSTPDDVCGEQGHLIFHGSVDQHAFIMSTSDACPDVNCSMININDSSLNTKCNGVFMYDEYLQFRKKSFPYDIIWWFNIYEFTWYCSGEDEIGYLTYKEGFDFTIGDCGGSAAYDTINRFDQIYKWCVSTSTQISNGEWSIWDGGSGYPFWWDGNHYRLETTESHYINEICISDGDSIDGIQVNFTDGNHSVLGGTNGGKLTCYSTRLGQCFTDVSWISSYDIGIVRLEFYTSNGESMHWGSGSGALYQTHYGPNHCITKMEFYSNNYVQRIRFYFQPTNITSMPTVEPTNSPSDSPTNPPTTNPTVIPLILSNNPTISPTSMMTQTEDISTSLTDHENTYQSHKHTKSKMSGQLQIALIIVIVITILIGVFVIGYCFNHKRNKIKKQLMESEMESIQESSQIEDKNQSLILKGDKIVNE